MGLVHFDLEARTLGIVLKAANILNIVEPQTLLESF